MLKDILKLLGESVESQLDEATQAELSEKFDAIVSEKAEELADLKAAEIVAEKEVEYEAYIAEEQEKATTELSAQLDEYLNLAVEEYFVLNQVALDESVDAEKVKALLEGLDAMLITAGVEIAKIDEAKDDSDLAKKVEELESKVDEAVNARLATDKENKELLRLGVVAEKAADLSETEKDKFVKMANLVSFDEVNEEYSEKLDGILETVLDKKPAKVEETDVSKAPAAEDEVIVEKVADKASSKYASHLV